MSDVDESERTYSEALAGLTELLRLVDEESWRSALERHREEWDRAGDVRSHLSVYGGMGSFNDVLLVAENGYRVSRAQEGWVNTCRGQVLQSRIDAAMQDLTPVLTTVPYEAPIPCVDSVTAAISDQGRTIVRQ